MKLSQIYESIEIIPVEYSDEAFYDSDGYSVWEQAFAIASNSGIHIDSDKELSYVAIDNNQVVGAVWYAIYQDEDQDAQVYDFDMAVHKNYRQQVGIFLQLMNAALEYYKYLKMEDSRTYIRVWVINPKLVGVLERRYGFEVESELSNDSCIMVYYGD